MNTENDIVNYLEDLRRTDFSISILAFFKLPFMLLILGNFIFIFLLIVKIKILADIIDCPNNKLIKKILRTYIGITIIASLVSLFFILL